MKRRKRTGDQDGMRLELTSMIDVVFLLLIFFLSATQFRLPEGTLRAFLPASGGTSPEDSMHLRPFRLTLRLDGTDLQCFADDRRISTDPANYSERVEGARGLRGGPDESELAEHLLRRKASYRGLGSEGLPVIIDFAGDVPYKYINQALNLVHVAGITDVRMARPEADDPF